MKRLFVRLMLYIATLAAAMFLAGMLSQAAAHWVFLPPLVLLTTLAWLPAFPLSWRLWIAGSVGCMIDTVSDTPFGANILLMLAASLLIGAFSAVFSGRGGAIRWLGAWAALAVCIVLLSPLARASAAFMHTLLP